MQKNNIKQLVVSLLNTTAIVGDISLVYINPEIAVAHIVQTIM